MLINPISPAEISLSNGWWFTTDVENTGEVSGWHVPEVDQAGWHQVTVPHTWNTMEEYASYEGIAWYRLEFNQPVPVMDGCFRLHFDAVFYLARVWMNGIFLGEHEGGYTPFEFDVTRVIKQGYKNSIVVRVDNIRATDRLPAHLYEGRSYGWNNYGGIVRDVKLIVGSQVYLDAVRLVPRPHIVAINQADQVELTAHVALRNVSCCDFRGQITLQVLDDQSNSVIMKMTQTVTVTSTQDTSVLLSEAFYEPSLWHFDHPFLYSCLLSLTDTSGVEYDRKIITFGIREIRLKDGHFFLNGEPVRLVGLSRHADVPGYGLAEPAPIMKKDFDDLKNLNMVCARPVHYPQHEFIYDYCDRNGILLSPELPAWQLTAGQMDDEHIRSLAKQQLLEMISAACNHPCIWAWSVGNELESDTVSGRAFVHDMVAYVKSLDPTRPVGFASYHLLVGRPWGDATKHADFVMMNQYFGTWHGPKSSLGTALDTIHLTWPEKIVIVSEFGFAPHWQHVEGPKIIDPEQYYQIPEDVSADSIEADKQRQLVIMEQMAVYRSKAYIVGATFWDYRGVMGVVDENGHPRPSWKTLQDEYSPIMIEQVKVTPIKIGQYNVFINLRTRGPVEVDLPVYTLRNYSLGWEVLFSDGKQTGSYGKVDLPVLTPCTKHKVHLNLVGLESGTKLQIFVMRPTGFTVIQRVINL